MKLKKHQLLILLILLMIQLPLNSQNKNLKQTSTIQLSESKTTFSKKEVLQLIDEIKAEAEKSIDDAFNEGYKAATVFYKPKLQGYEIQLETLKHELNKEKRNNWLNPVYSLAGAAVGFGCGYIKFKLVQ